MQQLTTNATITSLELLEAINAARAEHDQSAIRRNDFHARVADELDGEFYETFVIPAGPTGGRPSQGLYLTTDQCMLVSMRESKAVRRSVLAKLKGKQSAFQVPATMAEALRLAADQAEQLEQQAKQIEAARPAVEFKERYVDTGTTKTLRETAKILGVPEKAFITQLIDDKVLYRQSGNLLPHQKHHAAQRFDVKTGERNGHAYTQTRVTTKGIDYLAGAYGWMMAD